MSQQSPPEPARGLGVFSQSDAAPGNLSYAPFGGFSTAPPPPERAAVSALGGAEFIPRTSSAGAGLSGCVLLAIAMTVMNKTVRVGAKNLRKRGDTYLKIGNTFKVALAGQGWRGESATS